MKSIEEYIKKKEKFLKTTTVKEFQQAVVSRAEVVHPKGMAEVTIKVLNISEENMRTMNDMMLRNSPKEPSKVVTMTSSG